MALIAYKGTTQTAKVICIPIIPGFNLQKVQCAAGQGRTQDDTIRVTRQVAIDEPDDANIDINCPIGPAA